LRAGVRKVWGLLGTMHCALLPLITSRLLIISMRLSNVWWHSRKSVCWATASFLVSLRVMPFGLDGCHLLSVPMFTTVSLDIDSILRLIVTPAAIGQCFGALYPLVIVLVIVPSDVGRANLLVELLLLRPGVLTFSSSELILWRRLTVWLRMLHASSFFFFFLVKAVLCGLFFFFFLVLCVRSHNK